MRIGELARLAGCKVVTIRFYERKGLLECPGRNASNYREYGKADAERLNFIRHCRGHGMSLAEIAELLELAENAGADCKRVHAIIARHLEEIEKQIAGLEQLKDSLDGMLRKCAGKGDRSCAVLEHLRDARNCAYCGHCE